MKLHEYQAKAVLAQAGVPIPTNWNEFVAAAPALEKAGKVPLAQGRQSWQTSLTFQVGIRNVAANDRISVSTVDATASTLGLGALTLAFIAYVFIDWTTGPFFAHVPKGPSHVPTWASRAAIQSCWRKPASYVSNSRRAPRRRSAPFCWHATASAWLSVLSIVSM